MDAINFVNYLKNPGYLHQVTFQELNNLIEQYPFCQNLHYLALRKAQNENHKDFVKKLELAATYCPNRKWLYKQLQDVQTPQAISDALEEVVEVEDITIEGEAIQGSESQLIPILDQIDEEVHFIKDDFENNPESDEGSVPSHSISDSEQIVESLSDPIDTPDLNLENPEDMKLPDEINKEVIYMEDLFEDIPIHEESPPPVEPLEEKITISDQQIDDPVNSPVTPPETDTGSNPDIPFEIYIPGEELWKEEETEVEVDLENEPTIPMESETEHAKEDIIDQPAPTLPVEEPFEEIRMSSDQDDEEEEIHLEEDISEEVEEDIADQVTEVAPMPKTAFSSWRQINASPSKPAKKKKETDNKPLPSAKRSEKKTVYEVTNLFKEKKKKKGEKKKKKKRTKGYAMESLLEHEDVISETLAELLAEQGSRKKAIKMYNSLIKMHPEKKEIYSNRIKKLKKKA